MKDVPAVRLWQRFPGRLLLPLALLFAGGCCCLFGIHQPFYPFRQNYFGVTSFCLMVGGYVGLIGVIARHAPPSASPSAEGSQRGNIPLAVALGMMAVISLGPLFITGVLPLFRPISPLRARTQADDQYDALERAVKTNNLARVRSLLAQGASPDYTSERDWTDGNGLFCEYPLVTAVKQDNFPIAKALIAAQALPDLQYSLPLSIAASHGNIAMMRLMVQHGAVVNGGANGKDSYALWYAVQADHPVAVAFLLDGGHAWPNSHGPGDSDDDSGSVSVLKLAESKGDARIIALLRHAGARE